MSKLLLTTVMILTSFNLFSAYDCQLETPFDGTFDGRASTEYEAKREAVYSCESELGYGDFWCKQSKVTCVKMTSKLCTLETPFDGTFEAYSATEVEGKRGAVKACESVLGRGDFWCKEREVECFDL